MTQAVATREHVATLIRQFPGLHVQEVAREASMSKQLANYHLRQLVAEGRIREIREGEYCRFFASDADALTQEERTLIVLLRQPALLQASLLLLEHGKATHLELTQALGLSKATVSYHLGRLMDAEVVLRVEGGAGFELADPTLVRSVLVRWRPPTSITERAADVWGRFYAHGRQGQRKGGVPR